MYLYCTLSENDCELLYIKMLLGRRIRACDSVDLNYYFQIGKTRDEE